jgi:hypothetical protein
VSQIGFAAQGPIKAKPLSAGEKCRQRGVGVCLQGGLGGAQEQLAPQTQTVSEGSFIARVVVR